MRIHFQFDLAKAVQAMAYLIDRLGPIDKVKLTKLLYIADRDCFLRHGHPITGDVSYAMRWGPVPSACLDALDGQVSPVVDPAQVYAYIHVDDNQVMLRRKPDVAVLEDGERQVLDDVVRQHGRTPSWTLVEQTHQFPEYREVYVEGTATPIPYELMLKHYGEESQFRLGRPVISPQMQAHMVCPLPEPEPDL